MTRIVAGAAKGRRLAVPPRGTRPTSDRAREALFNSLRADFELDGSRVLDLYAGSGAVGLEALSRGAATVTLVESDRSAGAVLRANVSAVGIDGAEVVARPVASFLAGPAEPYDLVFADPPYAVTDDELAGVLGMLAERAWLADEAVIVVERSARSPQPRWPDVIEAMRDRRYGEGVLWYGRRR